MPEIQIFRKDRVPAVTPAHDEIDRPFILNGLTTEHEYSVGNE